MTINVEFLFCSKHADGMYTGMSTTAVYMMASRKHGTIYIGVTGRFIHRISEHREKLRTGFTSRYGVTRLVWYEMHEAIVPAIKREKALKKYKREWKINLIERDNPNWDDLYDSLFLPPPSLPLQDVMAGLVPATHDLRNARGGAAGPTIGSATKVFMGGRDKPGHDDDERI